ncbi:MAG: adenylate/guanylate cyclase domain-containing protein [Candidatus Binataceae bacterium]
MRCQNCSAENPEGAKFCIECAAPIKRQCPQCSFDNPATAKFCAQCATPLRAAAIRQPLKAEAPNSSGIRVTLDSAAPGALDGERKTVTALFTDIKGSTELEQDLDPEEARAIVDPVLKLMIDAVRRYDGYVVQSTGDGIFALFGAPVAHEDHPQRALYAALRMQEELRRYSARLRETGNLPLEARVGVNTGEVVVRSITTGQGQTEYTPIGHTANLASRMQALAPTGSIAISEQTRKLAEGYFALKPMGPTRVKGVSDPVNVYEVTGLGPLRTRLQRSAGRGLTKFVGRAHEMETLKRALEQARTGHGQIVAAMAEPGVGKSRLFYEFKAVSQSGCMVLETFSVSHGKASAYLPIIDLLHGYLKIAGEDDQRARRAKVTGNVLTLDRALEDALPYLFALLGLVEGDDPLTQMDGQLRKRRTLEAIKRILLRESINQPLMVIFEDLHWIDEQTQEFLNLLADSIGTAKILLLVNYRPEYSHQWGSKTYYMQLRLDPLGRESAEKMLSALLGDGAELAPLKRLIIEKTEGTPFFMEETVQVLLDEGSLVRNVTVKLTKPLAELKIPPTVQAILAARIDRLPSDAKDLLQTLSVIGREFPLSLISAVVRKSDAEINRLLKDLQQSEFIYEQPAVGDTEYVFKHALTQEVAYNALLVEQRKLLHERAGEVLESMFAGQLDDHLYELARQYSRSDNLTKAVEYLGRAGQLATQHSAHTEGIGLLNSAVELLQRLPVTPERDQSELELHTALAPALMVTKGWGAPETEKVYVRAYELSSRGGIAVQRFSALMGLYALAFAQGKLPAAREWEKQLLSLAEQQQVPALLLEAHHACWSTALSMGELAAAEAHIEKGLASYEPQLHNSDALRYTGHDAAVCARSWGALISWIRGYPGQAIQRNDRALAMARELGDPFTVAFSFNCAAQMHHLLRSGLAAEKQAAEAALAAAAEGGFPVLLAWGLMLEGRALAQQGQVEAGIARIHEGLGASRATGTELWRTYWLSLLAETCGRAGRISEGMTAATEALAVVQRTAEHWFEAELYRLKGELALRQNDSKGARSCFERAIEIARAQDARSLELRATMSLARLLANQGKRDEARAMLAEIYGWFTEGFDTADLKDAKALLDQWGA